VIGIFRSLQESLPTSETELRAEIATLEGQLVAKKSDLELVIRLATVISSWSPKKNGETP
jgi:hypothetical protein